MILYRQNKALVTLGVLTKVNKMALIMMVVVKMMMMMMTEYIAVHSDSTYTYNIFGILWNVICHSFII